jgi:hypothetical protein
MEQFGLVHSSHIAAIYSIKKEFSEDKKILKEILDNAEPEKENIVLGVKPEDIQPMDATFIKE